MNNYVELSSAQYDYLKSNEQFAEEMYLGISDNDYNTYSLYATKVTTELKRLNRISSVSSMNEQALKEQLGISHIDPYIATYFSFECARIKNENPDWSDSRVYWEATKEVVHIILDLGGLAPGVGEIFDIANGVIYQLEGDGLNASLSYASAIPFAGWYVTGGKYATKYGWKFIVKTDGYIDFGVRNSAKFRKQLNLVKGDGMIGHHLVPWNMNNHPVVQAAAKYKSAWHPNDAFLNGKAVTKSRHSGSHYHYDEFVRERLNSMLDHGLQNDPKKAYEFLEDLAKDLKNKIENNPSKSINELFQ